MVDGRVKGRSEFGDAVPLFAKLMEGKIKDPVQQKAFDYWYALLAGGHRLRAGGRFSETIPTASQRSTFLSFQRSRSESSIVLSSYGMDDEFGCRLA